MLLQSVPACVYLGLGKCKVLLLFCLCFKDQNSRHFEEHRETDDTSEKMSPNKNLKSPQKGSKRLKTAPFKVTLLDSALFEGEIEVCRKKRPIKSILFNSLIPLLLFSSVGGSVYFIVLWRIHKAAKQNQCESTMLRGTRREMQHYTPLPSTKKTCKIHMRCVVNQAKKKDVFMFCPKGKIQDVPEKRKEQREMHFILLKFW